MTKKRRQQQQESGIFSFLFSPIGHVYQLLWAKNPREIFSQNKARTVFDLIWVCLIGFGFVRLAVSFKNLWFMAEIYMGILVFCLVVGVLRRSIKINRKPVEQKDEPFISEQKSPKVSPELVGALQSLGYKPKEYASVAFEASKSYPNDLEQQVRYSLSNLAKV